MAITFPWTRGTEAQRAANSTVPAAGMLAVTSEGNVYAADGATAWNVAPRLAKASEVTAEVTARTTAVATKVGKGELMVNVQDYGATGNGTTDDTAAIQAAATAAANRTLYFPPGFVYYLATGGITITSPTKVIGGFAGNDGNPHGSVIRTGSGVSGFLVSADRVSFEDLFFLASTNQPAAETSQTTAITFTTGDHGSVRRCRFNYYCIAVWFKSCQFWTVEDNYFAKQSGYHLYIQNTGAPDGGDQNIRGNWFTSGIAAAGTFASGGASGGNTITFTAAPNTTYGSTITGTGVPANTYVAVISGNTLTLSNNLSAQAAGSYAFDNWAGKAGVRQESGGGVRFIGNKVIYGPIGYQLATADASGTSILPITGNSFELQTSACIDLTSCTGGYNTTGGSTGTFRAVIITGNQFTGINIASTGGVVWIHPTAANQISDVLINSNDMRGTSSVTTFVRAAYVKGLTVQNNRLVTGLTAVAIDGNSSDSMISPNHITGLTSTIYASTGQNGASAVPLIMDAVKPFTVTSTTAFLQVALVGFTNIGGCLLEVEVLGNLQGGGLGGFMGKFTRLVTLATAGGVPALTTVGTDVQAGVVFNYQFVASAGSVGFQLERGADGGTTLIGSARIVARGSQSTIV